MNGCLTFGTFMDLEPTRPHTTKEPQNMNDNITDEYDDHGERDPATYDYG